MNINIAILACLALISGHKKLLVQILIQFIKNQASFGCHQCTVCVGITFISNIPDGLTLGIDIVHHMDKIHFIIPVIPVTFCHIRIHFFQGTFHNIMHLCNGNAFFSQAFRSRRRIAAQFLRFFFRKCVHRSGGRFIYCTDNLLYIKFFSGSIFFDYVHTSSLLFFCLYLLCGSTNMQLLPYCSCTSFKCRSCRIQNLFCIKEIRHIFSIIIQVISIQHTSGLDHIVTVYFQIICCCPQVKKESISCIK